MDKWGVDVQRHRLSGPDDGRFVSQPEPAMKNAAAHRATREMQKVRQCGCQVQVLSIQYLNNLVELGSSESESRIRAIRRSVGTDFWNRADRED
jgi:hypothetical protein